MYFDVLYKKVRGALKCYLSVCIANCRSSARMAALQRFIEYVQVHDKVYGLCTREQNAKHLWNALFVKIGLDSFYINPAKSWVFISNVVLAYEINIKKSIVVMIKNFVSNVCHYVWRS